MKSSTGDFEVELPEASGAQLCKDRPPETDIEIGGTHLAAAPGKNAQGITVTFSHISYEVSLVFVHGNNNTGIIELKHNTGRRTGTRPKTPPCNTKKRYYPALIAHKTLFMYPLYTSSVILRRRGWDSDHNCLAPPHMHADKAQEDHCCTWYGCWKNLNCINAPITSHLSSGAPLV